MNVSVIIPASNASATLTEPVDSLLTQTFVDWEVIIVDDGSNDDTIVVAERFAKRDGRIRVVSPPHQGVGTAGNTGIDLTRYEWLLFLGLLLIEWVQNGGRVYG